MNSALAAARAGNAPGSLREWSTTGVLFSAGTLVLLLGDAAVRGAGVQALLPAASAFIAGTVLWIASFFVRHRFPRSASFVRFFLPLALYGAAYTAIHTAIASVRPGLVDETLIAIDAVMFGQDPVAWLGRHGHPLLTDALSLAYVSYYAGMPVLVVLLWRDAREEDFRVVLSGMTVAWYGALFTYAAFPALGPQRYLAGTLPTLTGWLPTTEWIHAFLATSLTPEIRDCVPSMHTGVTLLTLFWAARLRPGFFRIYLLPGLGLILATVALQQHYVIDVLLGVLAAAGIAVWQVYRRPL